MNAVGELVRIEGLQNAREHNGRLGWVVAAPAAGGGGEQPPADARAVVRLAGDRGADDPDHGPELRVRPANLRPAYYPKPWGEICEGSAEYALGKVLALFPDDATAVVHYFREDQSSEQLSRSRRANLFTGSFDVLHSGECNTMPRATCEQATSKTCALHVKIMDVPGDSVELILVGQQEQGRRRRVWRDGGLPRELGRVPLRAARRTKAIESDTPAARAFQRLMFERFLGAPNKSEDDPAFYVFKGAVELAIGTRACSCHSAQQG